MFSNQSEGAPEGQFECLTPISNLSYPIPEHMFVGNGAWLEPSFDGDEANDWDVTCTDPSVLVMTNGSIHFFASDVGTLDCMVEVRNVVSDDWFNFSIAFIEHPPSNIDVGAGAWVFVKGQPAFMPAPDIEGDQGVWTIHPELPLGLSFNILNGSISGVAFYLQSATVYTLSLIHI